MPESRLDTIVNQMKQICLGYKGIVSALRDMAEISGERQEAAGGRMGRANQEGTGQGSVAGFGEWPIS